jgi:urease accessory protein
LFKHIILLAFLIFPYLAHAHVGQGGGGFLAGLGHPVLGFDHLLAMISVGILSAQMGGRAIWIIPTTFVLIMTLGALLGMKGIPLFSVEIGIALSVFSLGIALAAEKNLPTILAMGFVGLFAIFHGHAHGNEMPQLVEPALYALGFVTGTASLHLSGVFLGLSALRTTQGASFLRYLGAGIAGVGFHLLIA